MGQGQSIEGKKSGCCPTSLSTRGQNPSGPGATKMDIRNAYFFPCDGTRGGSKAIGNVGKVWGNIKSTFGTSFVIEVWLKMA